MEEVLTPYIDKNGIEVLNMVPESSLDEVFGGGGGFAAIRSNADCQLIIRIPFNQHVKISAILINGPPEAGPKNIKLYVDKQIDFSEVEQLKPTQALTITPDKANTKIPLRFVLFQNVACLTLFVEDNLGDVRNTVISGLELFGKPRTATKMNEFKRQG